MSNIQNLQAFDPFTETGEENHAEPTHYVHIRIQQRNGRKTLTTVTGVPPEYDLKKIMKVLKRELATNGNIATDSESGPVIQLQGDKRISVMQFLVKELGMPKKNIKLHGF